MLQLAEQFRLLLLARERRAATSIVQSYGLIWQRLQQQIGDLTSEIETLQLAGDAEAVKRHLWRLNRVQALQAQADDQLATFSQFTNDTIAGGMRSNVAAGEREAFLLQQAAYPRGANVGITFSRLPREAIESMVGTMQDGSPLAKLLQEAVGDASKGFMDSLVTGMATGRNPRAIAGELRQKFGMGLTRSLTIARTEQLRAYRTATLNSYQQSPVVTGWERCAARTERTCAACLILDGKIYTTREAMDDHPNGRCFLVPHTKSYREMGIDADEPQFKRELGRDWLAAQPEVTQRSIMGNGRYDAWQSGALALDDIPMKVSDSTWGDSWVVRPLKKVEA
jgi:SPP1 gp7 family putative phage head morphogenesis protein